MDRNLCPKEMTIDGCRNGQHIIEPDRISKRCWPPEGRSAEKGTGAFSPSGTCLSIFLTVISTKPSSLRSVKPSCATDFVQVAGRLATPKWWAIKEPKDSVPPSPIHRIIGTGLVPGHHMDTENAGGRPGLSHIMARLASLMDMLRSRTPKSN